MIMVLGIMLFLKLPTLTYNLDFGSGFVVYGSFLPAAVLFLNQSKISNCDIYYLKGYIQII